MTCTRCQGRMIREHVYRRGAWWWRCYNCGERVDRAILLARAEQEAESAFLRASADIERKEWAAWMARMPASPAPVPGFSSLPT